MHWRYVLLNMAAVSAMEAEGVGILILIQNNINRQGCKLLLVNPTQVVRDQVVRSGMQSSFQIFDTEAAALKSIKK